MPLIVPVFLRRILALVGLLAFGCMSPVLLAPMPSAAEAIAGSAVVVDGDTLAVRSERIRLEGIDAPEAKQTCKDAEGRVWRCGKSASAQLASLIRAQEVKCEGGERDQYDRLIATCAAAGKNLSAEMVRSGMAWAFVKYSSTYVGIEKEARQARRGVFETENVPPWEFRAEQWKHSPQSSSADHDSRPCSLKGNINGKGDKIYHAPGQRDYDRAKINEAQGERWFCSDSEAERAGWRRAER